jgi:hypothetical protein
MGEQLDRRYVEFWARELGVEAQFTAADQAACSAA